MRPVRVSSEGPEVVPDPRLQTPDKYLVPFAFERPLFPGQQQVKKEDTPEPEQQYLPPHPAFSPTYSKYSQQARTTVRYDPVPYGVSTREGPRKRFGLITTLLLVLVAFIFGGGVGGGVGGALFAKEKTKVTQLQTQIAAATATSSAPPAASTVILDQAGCPLVNNSTYNSTTPGYTFLTQCASNIVPQSGSGTLDFSSSVQSSFDSCLDACATYNQNVHKGGCLGATWVIFDPTTPAHNSVCFLKNATGVSSAATGGQNFVSGFLQS